MELKPPAIAPVPATTARPRWSVMIPTYNCADYLRETLASVLAQDPGADQMQIEVIDDCSTRDDPAAVVRELAPDGRVTFYRHPANVGAIANFNACIARSRGHLVHILHGDDAVLPGFYPAIERLADAQPDCAFYATRSLVMDEQGVAYTVSPGFPNDGRLALSDDTFYTNPFVTPTIVMRRDFYERHGGFDPRFPHVADWEMWLRALQHGGGAVTRQVLAAYRLHRNNDTSRLVRKAGNLADYHQLFLHELPQRPSLDERRMRRQLGLLAFEQAGRFLAPADREAFVANRRVFWAMMGRRAGFLHLLGQRLGRQFTAAAARQVPATLPRDFPAH